MAGCPRSNGAPSSAGHGRSASALWHDDRNRSIPTISGGECKHPPSRWAALVDGPPELLRHHFDQPVQNPQEDLI